MHFSFTFLGSGTSQGVPIIGKEYPPRVSRQSEEPSHAASIYVESSGREARRGYHAGVSHPVPARKDPLAGCGGVHASARGPHHGSG